ncbi:MAG: 50S ribosomal protein L10 [Chloroflexi bacterium]|nr:50S ribosomal protein L10 [Chloroflexota bacterium]
MAIRRRRKEELVADYEVLFKESSGFVIASCSGVPVKDLEILRRNIREVGGEFHIVKNTLVKRALDAVGISLPEENLVGTTAIGFATDDVPGMARAVVELARGFDSVNIKGGFIDKIVYDAAQVTMLADLPPLPVLRAQLLRQLQAPGSMVAMLLESAVRQLLNVTKAYSESEEASTA